MSGKRVGIVPARITSGKSAAGKRNYENRPTLARVSTQLADRSRTARLFEGFSFFSEIFAKVALGEREPARNSCCGSARGLRG